MKIPVARLWHKKGKLEYFCFKQLLEYFPNIEFEFHIVLHSPEYKDEWSTKIDSLPIDVTWYSTSDILLYAKECDYIDDDLIQQIPNFVHFYHLNQREFELFGNLIRHLWVSNPPFHRL